MLVRVGGLCATVISLYQGLIRAFLIIPLWFSQGHITIRAFTVYTYFPFKYKG